jgi:prepilin-type N-terminal cleavage/methylation domain-containing protein
MGFRSTRAQRRRTTGLTLIEVLASVAILATAAFTSLLGYSLSQTRLNQQDDARTALELCQSQMEQDRTVAFSSLPTLNNASSQVAINSVINGTMTTTVQGFTENAVTAYYMVTVAVSWVEDGSTQTVQLVTYRSPYR